MIILCKIAKLKRSNQSNAVYVQLVDDSKVI